MRWLEGGGGPGQSNSRMARAGGRWTNQGADDLAAETSFLEALQAQGCVLVAHSCAEEMPERMRDEGRKSLRPKCRQLMSWR